MVLCLIIETWFQLGRYIHAYTNETHSSKSTRFNPYFGRHNYSSTNYGLNLVDLLESVFYLCMHGCIHLTGIVFVWSDTMLPIEWEASNFLARWLAILVSLLFIVTPTSLLNFNLFKLCQLDISSACYIHGPLMDSFGVHTYSQQSVKYFSQNTNNC